MPERLCAWNTACGNQWPISMLWHMIATASFLLGRENVRFQHLIHSIPVNGRAGAISPIQNYNCASSLADKLLFNSSSQWDQHPLNYNCSFSFRGQVLSTCYRTTSQARIIRNINH
ncbi:hypothetical protein KEM48_013167 [Puccinia striiformis f. sp. tritici PST-130]|nr:hypothetical protein KEM48_013167 [Puccinia striiformis f. sp. tritici PST-130]